MLGRLGGDLFLLQKTSYSPPTVVCRVLVFKVCSYSLCYFPHLNVKYHQAPENLHIVTLEYKVDQCIENKTTIFNE